jgi:hypothetical protein
MDQTTHFEHRADELSPRWELRRAINRITAKGQTTPRADSTQPESDTSPTHDFLD